MTSSFVKQFGRLDEWTCKAGDTEIVKDLCHFIENKIKLTESTFVNQILNSRNEKVLRVIQMLCGRKETLSLRFFSTSVLDAVFTNVPQLSLHHMPIMFPPVLTLWIKMRFLK